MLLEGIFLPLTTPFHPDGRLFLHKLALNVEHYSRTQAAGMLVLGDVGEGAGLTDEESRQVLTSVIQSAAEEKVMLAVVGRDSVAASLALIEIAGREHYDAVAICPPQFSRDPEKRTELVTYFNTVADRSPLPVVILCKTRLGPPSDVLAELAAHPRIIGAIDGAGFGADRVAELIRLTSGISREVTVTSTFGAVTERMLRRHSAVLPADSVVAGPLQVLAPPTGLKTRVKQVGFQVLTSWTGDILVGGLAGASGAVPHLAACAPQACCEVWQALKDGDEALASEKQERIREAGELVGQAYGIAALKYGCDLNAYFGGQPRLPLLPLTAEQRDVVQQALAGMKN